MQDKDALDAFGALAKPHRLAVFRMLVRVGPAGMAAGEIAEAIGVPASTLSHHLSILERGGLLTSRRVERRILYAVDVAGTRRLIGFLSDECCNGAEEICGLAALGAAQHGNDARGESPADSPVVRLRNGT